MAISQDSSNRLIRVTEEIGWAEVSDSPIALIFMLNISGQQVGGEGLEPPTR